MFKTIFGERPILAMLIGALVIAIAVFAMLTSALIFIAGGLGV